MGIVLGSPQNDVQSQEDGQGEQAAIQRQSAGDANNNSLGFLKYFAPRLPTCNPVHVKRIRSSFSIDCGTMDIIMMHNIFTFYLRFKYDALVDCQAKFYFMCEEEVDPATNATKSIKQIRLDPNVPRKKVYSFNLSAGKEKQVDTYSMGLSFSLEDIDEELFKYDLENTPRRYPLILVLRDPRQSLSGEENPSAQETSSLLLYFSFEYLNRPDHRNLSDETSLVGSILYIKSHVAGRAYFLEDIYGIQVTESKECLICMTNLKNTIVIPCRHICLCTECAMALRLQTDKCPVCRSLITHLLKINGDLHYPERTVTQHATPRHSVARENLAASSLPVSRARTVSSSRSSFAPFSRTLTGSSARGDDGLGVGIEMMDTEVVSRATSDIDGRYSRRLQHMSSRSIHARLSNIREEDVQAAASTVDAGLSASQVPPERTAAAAHGEGLALVEEEELEDVEELNESTDDSRESRERHHSSKRGGGDARRASDDDDLVIVPTSTQVRFSREEKPGVRHPKAKGRPSSPVEEESEPLSPVPELSEENRVASESESEAQKRAKRHKRKVRRTRGDSEDAAVSGSESGDDRAVEVVPKSTGKRSKQPSRPRRSSSAPPSSLSEAPNSVDEEPVARHGRSARSRRS